MGVEPDLTGSDLGPYDRLESVDFVRGDPETTNFKRRARLHQSQWRERLGIASGTQPMRPTSKNPGRYIGSRIALDRAYERSENFISHAALEAAKYRVAYKEPHQMLNVDRLYSDLLSSMPMCFNLFGNLHADLTLADKAIKTWWPDTPGKVSAVRFEWSPLRNTPGKFLGKRSAFDVSFELDMGDGTLGVLGVETKYHEDCKPEAAPHPEKRLPRYTEVTNTSGVFLPRALEAILGTQLQQIWLDHLLALSMLQHIPLKWTWAKFILVHPRRNPSYARAADKYQQQLKDSSSFDVVTIESLLEAGVLPSELVHKFTERYLW